MEKYLPVAFLSVFTCVAYGNQLPDSTGMVNLESVEVYSYKSVGFQVKSSAQVAADPVEIERFGIESPHGLSAMAPNFHMPDYGSKLTSAIYIRGIGSRMNDPAAGMYVDNIPILDKSMYDFDFYDLSRIEILRGPQGTLYGRNSMGGIINIYTPSPLLWQGTRLRLSYGSANSINAQASHHEKLGENVGLSAGASYRRSDGFFTNEYDGRSADATEAIAARLRLDWRLSERWLMNYSLSAEKSSQDGYPYGLVDEEGRVGAVNYNDYSGYERRWLLGSVFWQYDNPRYSIAGTTSLQYFDDEMNLDQDFTPADLFTLKQIQKQNAYTQEVVAKSKSKGNYRWLAGVFGFYKGLDTQAPVVLKEDFFASVFPPFISATDNCYTSGSYDTPSYGLAAFHQSDLRAGRWTLTAGLRLDYEKVSMKHITGAELPIRVLMPPMPMPVEYRVGVGIEGDDSRSFLQLSPKLALNYSFYGDRRVYVSVSRGYRSGGYNIQLFSDLISGALMSVPMGETYKQVEIDPETIYYKPEHNWNYEAGGHMTFAGDRIQVDASVFYIDSRNQQVTQFVPSGLGRVMRNAGRSSSCGGEVSARGDFRQLSLYASYGFTNARFREYSDSVDINGAVLPVDYKGKVVPFAPRHTLCAGVEKSFGFRHAWIERLVAGMQFTGAGKTYFTESNDAKQDFYGTLNASIGIEKGIFALSVWGKNITDTSYKAFFFHGMNGNSFAQRGNPAQVGVTLRMNW